MATPILGITELSNNQVNQFATANEAFRGLESAFNDFISLDFAAGDIELTLEQFTGCFLFRATANTVSRVLELPQNKRFFAVQNTGSATLTIKMGATELSLATTLSAFYYTDGTADGIIKIG